MAVAIVTGSTGLIGSETVKFLQDKGLDVVGIDNNLRQYFFGEDGSTDWNKQRLLDTCSNYTHIDQDIRDQDGMNKVWSRYGKSIELIVHTAAQPSHDWAAREPHTDFTVNANGTLNLLEVTRQHCPEASFVFTSTNKVYGDLPNGLPLVETKTRWEVDQTHRFAEFGIDETMSIDGSKHSLFGASKVAADILVQEYGRYFGMKTVSFRGGCLTGPAHSGAELHGFLAYLVKCAITGRPYTVYGYKGKQVRDNIHARDLVECFWQYYQNPKVAAVYNIGGSRHSNCSILEAFAMAEELTGKKMNYTVSDEARAGDHIWYVSDVRSFQYDYPNWKYQYDLRAIMQEIVDAASERYGS